MVGTRAFSGDSLPEPAAGVQQSASVVASRDNDLLGWINTIIGEGNFAFPDVAAGAGNVNKVALFSSGSTTSLSNVVRAGTDFNIAADGTSGQVLSTDSAGALSFVNNSAAPTYSSQSGNFTIAVNTKRLVDAGATITLPNSPSDGDSVWVKPSTGQDLESSSLTIAQNGDGDTIAGDAASLTVDINAEIQLVHDQSQNDWDVIFNPVFRS